MKAERAAEYANRLIQTADSMADRPIFEVEDDVLVLVVGDNDRTQRFMIEITAFDVTEAP